MARRASNRSSKAVIRVFCEGESEQAYIDYLKKQFQDVAAIKYPRGTGLFETAKDKFSKDPKYTGVRFFVMRIVRPFFVLCIYFFI